MSTFNKPTDVPRWADNEQNITTPSEAKQDSGWLQNEAPASSVFNWFQNLTGQWFKWLNERFLDGSTNDELVVDSDTFTIQNASTSLSVSTSAAEDRCVLQTTSNFAELRVPTTGRFQINDLAGSDFTIVSNAGTSNTTVTTSKQFMDLSCNGNGAIRFDNGNPGSFSIQPANAFTETVISTTESLIIETTDTVSNNMFIRAQNQGNIFLGNSATTQDVGIDCVRDVNISAGNDINFTLGDEVSDLAVFRKSGKSETITIDPSSPNNDASISSNGDFFIVTTGGTGLTIRCNQAAPLVLGGSGTTNVLVQGSNDIINTVGTDQGDSIFLRKEGKTQEIAINPSSGSDDIVITANDDFFIVTNGGGGMTIRCDNPAPLTLGGTATTAINLQTSATANYFIKNRSIRVPGASFSLFGSASLQNLGSVIFQGNGARALIPIVAGAGSTISQITLYFTPATLNNGDVFDVGYVRTLSSGASTQIILRNDQTILSSSLNISLSPFLTLGELSHYHFYILRQGSSSTLDMICSGAVIRYSTYSIESSGTS